MLELLGLFGIILTVLIFGSIIGLTLRFQIHSKKTASFAIIGYGIFLFISTYSLLLHEDILYKLLNDYNSIIFAMISLLIIFTGFIVLRKKEKISQERGKLSQISLILHFICCFGAVVTTTMLIFPLTEISALSMGLFTAISLSLIITAFYLAFKKLLRIFKKPYPILLGNFMLFIGFYYLALAVIVPNITAVLSSKVNLINIPSVWMLIYAFITVVVLSVIGFFTAKKHSPLLQ